MLLSPQSSFLWQLQRYIQHFVVSCFLKRRDPPSGVESARRTLLSAVARTSRARGPAAVASPSCGCLLVILAGKKESIDSFLDLCVSSLRRGHANLLCIVPILISGIPFRAAKRTPDATLFINPHGLWAGVRLLPFSFFERAIPGTQYALSAAAPAAAARSEERERPAARRGRR